MKVQSMKWLHSIKVSDAGFQELFDLQRALDKNWMPSKMSLRDKEIWSARLQFALTQEGAEFCDLINWKYWKKTRKPVDETELKYELIDQLHFLLSLFNLWGMDSKEVIQLYINKNSENFARIQRKY